MAIFLVYLYSGSLIPTKWRKVAKTGFDLQVELQASCPSKCQIIFQQEAGSVIYVYSSCLECLCVHIKCTQVLLFFRALIYFSKLVKGISVKEISASGLTEYDKRARKSFAQVQ